MYSWLLIIEMLFWVPTTPGIKETTEFSKSMKNEQLDFTYKSRKT
jgi:hypothetical protein